MSNVVESYRKLNESFDKVMIFHIGVDSGFFAEYTYMIHAMLYCLQHKIQFKLYSADANFGYDKGWTDYFLPFCEEVTEPFHRKHNIHPIPEWKRIISWSIRQKTLRFVKWKIKTLFINTRASLLAFGIYKRRTRLNHHIRYEHHRHFYFPQLQIDGDYLQAFNRLVDITFRFNEEVTDQCNSLIGGLDLPAHYIGCQVRGGDKIIETALLPPEYYVRIMKDKIENQTVFVLTDDYSIFLKLQELAPATHWCTLCSSEEKGYVNSSFTETPNEQKRMQMVRFFASMQVLLGADYFVGSITTGPSLLLLKKLYPEVLPVDCSPEDFKRAITLPIAERGEIMEKYLNSH